MEIMDVRDRDYIDQNFYDLIKNNAKPEDPTLTGRFKKYELEKRAIKIYDEIKKDFKPDDRYTIEQVISEASKERAKKISKRSYDNIIALAEKILIKYIQDHPENANHLTLSIHTAGEAVDAKEADDEWLLVGTDSTLSTSILIDPEPSLLDKIGDKGKFQLKQIMSEDRLNEIFNLKGKDAEQFLLFFNGFISISDDTSWVYDFDGTWHTQEDLTKKGPYPNSNLQKIVEKEKGLYIFALQFSNVHTTFHGVEPSIWMPNLLPSDSSDLIEYVSAEYWFQATKLLFLASLQKHEKTKKAAIEYASEILKDDLYKDEKNVYSLGRLGPETMISEFQQKSLYYVEFDAKKWDTKAKDVMKAAIFAKFNQNHLLRAMLVTTQLDKRILLQLKTDSKWGPGSDGKGENLLGVILMEVREALIKGEEIKIPDWLTH